MPKNVDILNINSNYIIRDIFSFLGYNKVLKLIKYNKNLQKIMNININDYSFDFTFDSEEETYKAYQINRISKHFLMFNRIGMVIKFILLLIFCFQTYYKRTVLFMVLLIFEIIFIFVTLLYLGIREFLDTKGDSCLICYIFLDIFNYIIEFIVIIVLLFFYDISNNRDRILLIVLDIISIVLCLVLAIIDIVVVRIYNKHRNDPNIIETEVVLKKKYAVIKKFKDFKINELKTKISEDFTFFTFNEINSFSNNLIYSLEYEQKQLIESINNLRQNHQIEKLKYDIDEKLNDFFSIIKNKSFFSTGNFFKLDYKTFLFIYPIGEFKIKFDKNDPLIRNIVLKDNLNKIIILQKENNKGQEENDILKLNNENNEDDKEYILIYEENEDKK